MKKYLILLITVICNQSLASLPSRQEIEKYLHENIILLNNNESIGEAKVVDAYSISEHISEDKILIRTLGIFEGTTSNLNRKVRFGALFDSHGSFLRLIDAPVAFDPNPSECLPFSLYEPGEYRLRVQIPNFANNDEEEIFNFQILMVKTLRKALYDNNLSSYSESIQLLLRPVTDLEIEKWIEIEVKNGLEFQSPKIDQLITQVLIKAGALRVLTIPQWAGQLASRNNPSTGEFCAQIQ